jgi:hypothetical protein
MRGFLLLFVAAVAAGCSQLAPSSVYRAYVPLSQAGYRDKQISEGVWEVTYHTDNTDRANYAERYARYRAAELAHQAEFPFFQIVQEEKESRIGPGTSSTTVNITVHGTRSRPEERMCEVRYLSMRHSRPCETLSTDEALRQFEPLKRQGRPSAEDPATVPD